VTKLQRAKQVNSRSGSQTRPGVRGEVYASRHFWNALSKGVDALGLSRNAYVQIACIKMLRSQGIYVCTECGNAMAKLDKYCLVCTSE
jgi:hypothetical protein